MGHRPLKDFFRAFAESECKDSSPLYFLLSQAISEDEELLLVAEHARPGQPVPNLLFAAIHYLLLSGRLHEVRDFYATANLNPKAPADAFPPFKDFVLSHYDEIKHLLSTRLVQTNEVSRSAYLLPAFLQAMTHFDNQPLALIEIGTSAGLNLLWDQYQYSYGETKRFGRQADVLISSSFRGSVRPVLTGSFPVISHRIGLDLNIVDTSNPDAALWLKALIWPEHHERRALLSNAIEASNKFDLDLREGDGFLQLPTIVEEIPQESIIGVFHTHVANQISKEEKAKFLNVIDDIGKKRNIVHIYNKIKPNLHLTAYNNACLIDYPLAITEGHAKWIEWL